MKRILLITMMIFMAVAQASIEYDGNDGKPTAAEMERNHSCFDELSKNGCGDPGDDLREFRSCMHDVYAKLTPDCQKMMTTLYKRK